MNPENEREVFERASEAKAHANSLKEHGDLNGIQLMHLREIKNALELIERRSDPAADPNGERAEIEAEQEMDRRRERHFDRHGHFGPGHDPGPD